MKEPPFDVTKAERWFAIELNNQAWDLLASSERTAEEDERLLYAAHASVHHWLKSGTIANHARGECLVANVLAVLGHAESAVRHARRCVELVEANRSEMADWDFAFAYDCLARAAAASGDAEEAGKHRRRASELGDKIAEEGDREFFKSWHERGDRHGI